MSEQVKEKGPFVIAKSTLRNHVHIRFGPHEWRTVKHARGKRGDIVYLVEWLNELWAEKGDK